MSLLESYRKTLKPLAVEEPIDVAWHRLLGFLVARACLPTPISADAITVAAIFIGVGSGVCIAIPFAHHLAWGAALCTLSAVFDCADGQLARMRQKSSNFGRMLDGVADSIVMAAIAIGAVVHLHQRGSMGWLAWLCIAATFPVCTFHFGHYDHYKNVYLRLTEPTYREGEDSETAIARKEKELADNKPTLVARFVWAIYLYYVRTQASFILATDPYTSSRLNLFPPYEARRAEIYARKCLGPMRVWRTLFGLGTHVFTLSIAILFDRFDLYVLFRLGLLNAIAYGWLVWWQRRASREAFAEMGLRLPDQRAFGVEGAANVS
ncbi:MAG: CDP-alcohol phosphatidyltransferase family protein [Polyangiales bacterium]